MSLPLIELLLGLAVTMAGNELLLRGVVSLKRKPNAFATTVIFFSGSLPKLIVCLQAASGGSPDMAMGVIIGSVAVNLWLILGLLAIMGTLVAPAVTRRDAVLIAGAALLFILLSRHLVLSRFSGLLLFLALIAYIRYTRRTADARAPLLVPPVKTTSCRLYAVAYACIGLALLFTGADMLVDGANALGESWHMPEAAMGLGVVALLTSVPLLLLLLSGNGTQKRESALASLLGNTLFVLLGIGGLCAISMPIPVAHSFLRMDMWVMLASSVLAAIVLSRRQMLAKSEGVVFIALYAAYAVYQLFFAAP